MGKPIVSTQMTLDRVMAELTPGQPRGRFLVNPSSWG